MVLRQQHMLLGLMFALLPLPQIASAIDTDGDGVDDTVDACCNTPHGVDVNAAGRPLWDLDVDCDVDLTDYASVASSITLDLFAGLSRGFTAQLPPAGPCRPTNDDCSSPESLGEESLLFDTLGATTDGPDEPVVCDFFAYSHVESDIWFCYTSTCNGLAVVSLCGSNYDTKLAVYDGCACPSTNPVACSDEDCGRHESRVTFTAAAGHSYMVRAGGYRGDQGNGLVTVFCESDPSHGLNACRPGTGGCLAANGTPGCENGKTCAAVCGLDAFCCDTEWDAGCAEIADGIVNGFDSCAPGSGSCFLENETPGCDNVSCCQAICKEDPFCCLDNWDQGCLGDVPPVCGLFATCADGVGSCLTAHATPGCDDEACCNAVCRIDAPCCEEEWDAFCVDRTGIECD